jgi:hypothetical protein
VVVLVADRYCDSQLKSGVAREHSVDECAAAAIHAGAQRPGRDDPVRTTGWCTIPIEELEDLVAASVYDSQVLQELAGDELRTKEMGAVVSARPAAAPSVLQRRPISPAASTLSARMRHGRVDLPDRRAEAQRQQHHRWLRQQAWAFLVAAAS